MSRVLAYTSPMHGHLFPLVPVLEELRRRGHAIAVRTIASQAPLLCSLGFEAKPVDPAVEAVAMDDWIARTYLGAARRSTKAFLRRAALDGPDLGRAIAEERPDSLIVDVLSLGALSTAEASSLPWASFSPLPQPYPSRDVPPYGPGLKPARGRVARTRDRYLRALFQAGFDHLARDGINDLREASGLARLAHAWELFLRPPLLLQMSAEPFEYPRSDWPQNVRLVGPCSWDPAEPCDDRLAAIEKPLVLVSTSTDFQDDGCLVETAFEALAGERVHVVATVPSTIAQSPRPRVRANASLLPFAPHASILPRAVCAVTHGGMGVTQKAIAHGVPVCAVPFGRDQFEVARRVEVAGAGSRLPAWRLNPQRLRHKVREAIGKRGGAEDLARAFAAAGGPSSAADAFECLAGREAALRTEP